MLLTIAGLEAPRGLTKPCLSLQPCAHPEWFASSIPHSFSHTKAFQSAVSLTLSPISDGPKDGSFLGDLYLDHSKLAVFFLRAPTVPRVPLSVVAFIGCECGLT